MTDTVMEELIAEGKEQLLAHPDADQMIVVKTENNHLRSFSNSLKSNGADEKNFVEQISASENPVIKYVLCMWSDGSIEIPSMHFRNLLLDASAENAQAVIILQGTDGISCKKLITCMPNEK